MEEGLRTRHRGTEPAAVNFGPKSAWLFSRNFVLGDSWNILVLSWLLLVSKTALDVRKTLPRRFQDVPGSPQEVPRNPLGLSKSEETHCKNSPRQSEGLRLAYRVPYPNLLLTFLSFSNRS